MKDNEARFIVVLLIIWVLCMSVAVKSHMDNKSCNCTVNIGNQTLTIEDAFEYVTKGLSAHQWLEVQQAINQCEE